MIYRVYRKWGPYEGLDVGEMKGIADEASIKLSRSYDPTRGYPFYDYFGAYLYNYLRNYTHREHTRETRGILGFRRVGVCSSNVTYGFKSLHSDGLGTIEAREILGKLEEEIKDDPKLLEFYGHLQNGMNYAEAGRRMGFTRMSGMRFAKKLRKLINNKEI